MTTSPSEPPANAAAPSSRVSDSVLPNSLGAGPSAADSSATDSLLPSALPPSLAPPRPSGGTWVGRLAPPVLAIALVAWMLSRVDVERVLGAMAGAPVSQLVGLAVAFLGSLLLADTWATQKIYARTVCPVTWRELIVLRGASYLPSVLNHHLGQGWLTYFLSRVYGAQLLRVAGATLIVYVTTFACMVTIGLVALPFNAGRLPWLAPSLAVCCALGAAYMAVIALRPRWLQRPLLEPLFELGILGHLYFMLVRVPHMIVLFLGMWLPFRLFGVSVPFTDALALVPPLLFITGLPLTPQGVGTRDVLAVTLLASYAPAGVDGAAQVLAASLSWITALTVGMTVGSPLFMRRAYKLLGRASRRKERPGP
jgi:Lysylphosphatidylglycerol synthase TM region